MVSRGGAIAGAHPGVALRSDPRSVVRCAPPQERILSSLCIDLLDAALLRYQQPQGAAQTANSDSVSSAAASTSAAAAAAAAASISASACSCASASAFATTTASATATATAACEGAPQTNSEGAPQGGNGQSDATILALRPMQLDFEEAAAAPSFQANWPLSTVDTADDSVASCERNALLLLWTQFEDTVSEPPVVAWWRARGGCSVSIIIVARVCPSVGVCLLPRHGPFSAA